MRIRLIPGAVMARFKTIDAMIDDGNFDMALYQRLKSGESVEVDDALLKAMMPLEVFESFEEALTDRHRQED